MTIQFPVTDASGKRYDTLDDLARDVAGGPNAEPDDIAAFTNAWIRAAQSPIPIDPPVVVPPPTQSGGFTDLPLKPGGVEVHVSLTGSDTSGDGSSARPFRTVEKGYNTIRDGSCDHLCIHSGDYGSVTLNPGAEAGSEWRKTGKSAAEPMVVRGVGPTRPILRGKGGEAVFMRGTINASRGNLAIVGLEFDCTGNRAQKGFGWQGGGTGANLLIEDCVIRSVRQGISIEGMSGPFQIRRNIIIDLESGSSNLPTTVGVYCALNGGDILIEENLIDRINLATPGIFFHAIYCQDDNRGNVVVRWNTLSRAASHGLQLRCGGTMEYNMAFRCSLGMLLGGDGTGAMTSGVTGIHHGNICVESKNIDAQNLRGNGFDFKNVRDAQVVEALCITKGVGTSPDAAGFTWDLSSGVGVTATITRSKTCLWSPATRTQTGGGALRLSGGVVPTAWSGQGPAGLDGMAQDKGLVNFDAWMNKQRSRPPRVWYSDPMDALNYFRQGMGLPIGGV